MSDDIGVYDFWGDVVTVASSSVRQSLVASGSLNIRRIPQRRLYNRLLNNEAFRQEVGEPPDRGISSDTPPFTYSSLVASYSQQKATPPSWTQVFAGKKHGHVIPLLSSSDHEVSRLNARTSGVFALERSAVPASASGYYSKSSRFVRLYYKLSASALLPLNPGNEQFPAADENLDRSWMSGSKYFDSVSGSYRNNSIFNPSVFEIDVPDFGKIRDLRVWVEFIHDHRGGPKASALTSSNYHWCGGIDSGSITASYPQQGLQGVQIALRSPNVSFRYAHPLWNDPATFGLDKNPDTSLSAQYRGVPELLKNSYLLWAGHACEPDLGVTLGNLTSSLVDSINPEILSDISCSAGFADAGYGGVSVAVDSNNVPRIAYLQHTGSWTRVRYATSGAAGWKVETVYGAADTSNQIVLALDSRDNPYIAIANLNSGAFIARSSSATSWTVERITGSYVDAGGGSSTGVSRLAFAIDSSNNLHVATGYTIGSPVLRVGYFRSSSAGWSPELVENTTGSRQEGYVPALAVDSQGTPHLAYTDSVGRVTYARSGTGGWAREYAVTSSMEAFYGLAFSLGIGLLNDKPRIVFPSAFELSLLSSGSNGWVRETFDPHTSFIEHNYGGPGAIVGQVRSSSRPLVNRSGTLTSLFSHIPTSSPVANTKLRLASTGAFGRSQRWIDTQTGSFSYDFTIDSRDRLHFAWMDGSNSSNFRLKYALANGARGEPAYHEFDTDIDMRTTFADSSNIPNPRHLGHLYSSPQENNPGPSARKNQSFLREGKYWSPFSGAMTPRKSFDPLWFDFNGVAQLIPANEEPSFLTGANFPWMLDDRVPPGNFAHRTYQNNDGGDVGLFPPGWRNGTPDTPGYSNPAVNEFPSRGAQLGPLNIQPVYPLLDDIYVKKVFEEPTRTDVLALPPVHRELMGFRPGLRGTEINGKWKLLIGIAGQQSGSSIVGHPRAGIWFRQFRLEFLVDQRPEPSSFYPSKSKRFTRTSYVPQREGKRLIQLISGSAAWDIGVNYVYTEQKPDYGRSIGITDDTGSFVDSFAVFTRMTGALADALSGTLVRQTYLRNEFGTPYIPLSSGSAAVPTFDFFGSSESSTSREVFDSIFNSRPAIPVAQNLQSVLSRYGTIKSTRDLILEKLSSFTGSLA